MAGVGLGGCGNKRAVILNEVKDLTEAIWTHKICWVTKWESARSLAPKTFGARD